MSILKAINQRIPQKHEFVFSSIGRINQLDAIVIHHPSTAFCLSPFLPRSSLSLSEHIQYIRKNEIRKAIVVAENISFLQQCPCLEQLVIIPSETVDSFDYTPLYSMPNIKWLNCTTVWGEKGKHIAHIDYEKLPDVVHLTVMGKAGHHHVNALQKLTTLYLGQGAPSEGTLFNSISGDVLKHLSLCQSSVRSLAGVEAASGLIQLSLSYCRSLSDISALSNLRHSLRWLEIESCGKLKDFSPIQELDNLEYLFLRGSNSLPTLSFLSMLPKLQYFEFSMNCEDGDISVCDRIVGVRIKNRRHYNRKNSDFLQHYVLTDELLDW